MKLEQLQLRAARIVTGAKRGTSHEGLYRDVGWEKLEDRRVRQSLKMLFKMKSNLAPESLRTHLPQTREQRTEYNTRNPNNLTAPRTSSALHHNSFIPATIRIWNRLPASTKNATSLEQFKEEITPEKITIPPHYSTEHRKEQILQCRMRLKNADLKENLYSKNLAETNMCACDRAVETTEHYLLKCLTYKEERGSLHQKLNNIGPNLMTVDILLNGTLKLSLDSNKLIFLAVQHYIKDTKRFD